MNCIVIDDDLDHRIAFGVAFEIVSEEIEYYPLMFIDEALTIPNGIIQKVPDFIFMSMDMVFSNGLENIKKLKNANLFEGVPISVYSKTELMKDEAESFGASHFLLNQKSIKDLVEILTPLLSEVKLPFFLGVHVVRSIKK